MVEGFEEEAPPPAEGSMHINARGHRPLTSPFSRGRGGALCENGFNDPIADCVIHTHTVDTGGLGFCSGSTASPRVPLTVCIQLPRFAPHHSHICFNLFSHLFPSSASSLLLLLCRPYLCFPSLSFHAACLRRDVVTPKARPENTTIF
ncbi:unnamed protein product [Pleuronectes platessa]|uniref:Uncharacterized protein n=1 Tax=Pleuronectes platessa TaxID=8262 RepID=A0A9N7V2P9_PLEPL|nr:unnamed protein product [Pleuronectes platessa]